LRFVFVGGKAAVVALRPSRPARRTASFVRLLQHRLEAAPASEPVEALELYIPPEAWAPLLAAEPGLFTPAEADDAEAADLADRLVARLGPARVLKASLTADHRPERAYRWRPYDAREEASTADPPCGPRPLELFAPPEPLEVAADAAGAPYGYVDESGRREPLRVVRGPERVAAGWWDGADVDRAYFEVETRDGLRWWLYRDLADGGWRRHGAFS
jgi:protein ImuB